MPLLLFQVDRVVTETVCLLLKSTRDQSDKAVSVLASRCLGRIGAIDPGRLQGGEAAAAAESLETAKPPDDDLVADDEFGLDLLKVLIKSVLGTTETVEYESCSFTIQVNLKKLHSTTP